jgi:Na+/H+ antiporter NhaD/arsenite permease-like protein
MNLPLHRAVSDPLRGRRKESLRASGAAQGSGGRPTNELWLAAGLLGVLYVAIAVRQITGRGPAVWTVFVAGGFATVLVGLLSISGAQQALSGAFPVLAFLFALFLFASELDRSGAVDHLAHWLVGRAGRAEDVPLLLFLGFGIASAFIVNDALVVLGVPLSIAIARRLHVDARPLLLTLAFSVTVGSVLTPMGNPQNLLVSVQSGISDPVATFLRYLLLPTAINLAVGALYVRRIFRRSMAGADARLDRLRAEAPPLFPTGGWYERIVEHPSLVLFPATMIVIVTTDVTATITGGPPVPVYAVALGGAVLLMLMSSHRGSLLTGVNWPILLMFAGLFVVVGGAESGGVIGHLQGLLPIPGPSHFGAALPAILASGVAGPQLVSNVPWVALQAPLLSSLGYGSGTPVAWMALAAGSTLAGNVTLLGAASNLIVAERGESLGVRITLGRFAEVGIPLAAITIGILAACLAVGL